VVIHVRLASVLLHNRLRALAALLIVGLGESCTTPGALAPDE
jgi:hypothetical protein